MVLRFQRCAPVEGVKFVHSAAGGVGVIGEVVWVAERLLRIMRDCGSRGPSELGCMRDKTTLHINQLVPCPLSLWTQTIDFPPWFHHQNEYYCASIFYHQSMQLLQLPWFGGVRRLRRSINRQQGYSALLVNENCLTKFTCLPIYGLFAFIALGANQGPEHDDVGFDKPASVFKD